MSQLKKILVAYDGSPHSKQALSWALDLSLLSGAQVEAVHVFETSQLSLLYDSGGSNFLEMLDEIHREADEIIEEVVAAGQSRGVTVTAGILQGNVAEAILEHAERGGFDMIVAGTKGHGVLEGMLMGSVTRNLVSLSHIPVLVVKD